MSAAAAPPAAPAAAAAPRAGGRAGEGEARDLLVDGLRLTAGTGDRLPPRPDQLLEPLAAVATDVLVDRHGSRSLDDRVPEDSHPLHLDLDHVAGLEGTDARRSARRDDISWQQRHHAGDEPD